jgi:hypothetical protein
MRLLHAVAFPKKLRWLKHTIVISLKTQLHAVNACVKRSSQCSLKELILLVILQNCLLKNNYYGFLKLADSSNLLMNSETEICPLTKVVLYMFYAQLLRAWIPRY